MERKDWIKNEQNIKDYGKLLNVQDHVTRIPKEDKGNIWINNGWKHSNCGESYKPTYSTRVANSTQDKLKKKKGTKTLSSNYRKLKRIKNSLKQPEIFTYRVNDLNNWRFLIRTCRE